MLQAGHEKVSIIRSFSTPVIVDKVESFRRDGKGYVLLRTASPRTHAVQPSGESDPVDAIINAHISTEFDVEKGEDVHVLQILCPEGCSYFVEGFLDCFLCIIQQVYVY